MMTTKTSVLKSTDQGKALNSIAFRESTKILVTIMIWCNSQVTMTVRHQSRSNWAYRLRRSKNKGCLEMAHSITMCSVALLMRRMVGHRCISRSWARSSLIRLRGRSVRSRDRPLVAAAAFKVCLRLRSNRRLRAAMPCSHLAIISKISKRKELNKRKMQSLQGRRVCLQSTRIAVIATLWAS